MAAVVRQGAQWQPLRLGMAAALACLALGLVPSSAGAAPLADAGCPLTTDGAFLANGDRREAQTFTAIHTGGLTRATFEIDNPPLSEPNDFVLQVLGTDGNGFPVDPPLASATIPQASVPVGTATLDATFSNPPAVFAGQRYALALGRPGTATLFTGRTVTGNRCGGSPFFNTGPGWSPESDPSVDFIFQTYVDPAAISFALKRGNGFSLISKRGRLYAKVPGPGKLIVDDARPARRAAEASRKRKRVRNFIRRTKAKAKKAGLVPLRVELSKKGIRKVLATRKLNTPARVTYKPRGGEPSTIVFRIRIKL
jgi:hypothetical protein